MAKRLDYSNEADYVVVGSGSSGAVVAAERPVCGVILASPFDSLIAVGRLHYPWLPVSLLLRHPFDAATLAQRNRMPLLAIVGERDTIVPPARSLALFDAWAGPRQWHSIPWANHNDLAMDDTFWNAIDGFLRERASSPQSDVSIAARRAARKRRKHASPRLPVRR